ncbi:MMPL family transporter [Pseudoroseomonas globiformis]|uniref:MMPL family transporter n=1 Tax=Teichococcus globiformis TaxID=2307229 RepID=A0ABV7G1B6_9PROT
MSAVATAWCRLGLALTLLLLLGAVLLRGVGFRAEMSDLLPSGSTPAIRFMLEEFRSGTASTFLLGGIEGAPEAELARISRETGETLRASGNFSFVGNGAQDLAPEERDLLFRYRYLLSPALQNEPERLSAPALRTRLEALLDGLRSAAAPLLARFGFADPPGVFLDLLRSWMGSGQMQQRHGVWFAGGEGSPRALIVAHGRGTGTDLQAQTALIAEFRSAFDRSGPGEARLVLSGPGVFSTAAAAAIEADVHMIALFSGLLVAGFLLWRYRSLLVLAAVAVPLLAGTLAGTAAVALIYGAVHGAAFGFGMTMLGVVADYPMLLLTQRRPSETLSGAARRLGPTLALSAAAAALGLTAMLASGFPLLGQLGLFGAVGLLAGAAVTRWVLPRLLPGEVIQPRPLPAPAARTLRRLRGARWPLLALPLAALLLLFAGGPRWNQELDALSPVPERMRQEDEAMRRQLGAPDTATMIPLSGPDAEAVLRQAERVGAALSPLVARGVLDRFDSPARYLPSIATQNARQAALPLPDALAAPLREAAAGLPFRPAAFDRFLADLETSRALPPLTPEGLSGMPLLSPLLGVMLSERGGSWHGMVVPAGLHDVAAVRQAIAALDDPTIFLVEVKAETQALVVAATAEALRWVALGGCAVVLLLVFGLARQQHSARLGSVAALRVAAPIGGSLVVTLAVLTLVGEALNPFHLAALLLAVGVGLDYALFLGVPAPSMSTPPAEAEEEERILGSVLNCTVTTLLTFGLLAFCHTPVLRGIGQCVSIGVAAAFILALALAPRGVVTPPSLPEQRTGA